MDMNYTEKQLSKLPTAVQQYFRYCLKPGQSYVKTCELKHEGWFKTAPSKPEMPIRGEQWFHTESPEFAWKGRTKAFKAVDQFVDGNGKLSVYLLGLIRIVNEQGSEVSEAELLRWLGESVWFPTNLLPSDSLWWEEIDDLTASLKFQWKAFQIAYKVFFNESGEITELHCMRHMGKDGKKLWIGRLYDYKMVNEMKVPHRITASWILDGDEYQYVDFKVQEINHTFF